MSGILWGTGGLTGSLFGRATGLSPLAIAAYRLIAGGLLILVFLAVSRARLPRGSAAWRRIVLIGVLAATFQACYFASIALTSVSIATLVTIGMSPVLVLTFSGTYRERSSVITVCLAVTGFALLVGSPQSGLPLLDLLAGTGLALCSAAGFATVTLISARPVSGLDDLTTTGFAFTLGGLVLAPIAVPIGFHPTTDAVGWLVFLGTVPTAMAYTLYFRGLRLVSATTASLMALLEPLTAAVLAATFLGDRLSSAGLAGGAILILAVGMATVRPRPVG
jgi:DME family drug/metabolite transporter